MQISTRTKIALSIVVASAFTFHAGRTYFPVLDGREHWRLPPSHRDLVRAVAECLPVADCPCPYGPRCDLIFGFDNRYRSATFSGSPYRLPAFTVNFRHSKDTTDQSSLMELNITLNTTKSEVDSLPAKLDEKQLDQNKLLFLREFCKESVKFYWKDLNRAESSILLQELRTSYVTSLQKLGNLRVEVHVMVDPKNKSLYYSFKLKALPNQ